MLTYISTVGVIGGSLVTSYILGQAPLKGLLIGSIQSVAYTSFSYLYAISKKKNNDKMSRFVIFLNAQTEPLMLVGYTRFYPVKQVLIAWAGTYVFRTIVYAASEVAEVGSLYKKRASNPTRPTDSLLELCGGASGAAVSYLLGKKVFGLTERTAALSGILFLMTEAIQRQLFQKRTFIPLRTLAIAKLLNAFTSHYLLALPFKNAYGLICGASIASYATKQTINFIKSMLE